MLLPPKIIIPRGEDAASQSRWDGGLEKGSRPGLQGDGVWSVRKDFLERGPLNRAAGAQKSLYMCLGTGAWILIPVHVRASRF